MGIVEFLQQCKLWHALGQAAVHQGWATQEAELDEDQGRGSARCVPPPAAPRPCAATRAACVHVGC
jgi:hypothetical protein